MFYSAGIRLTALMLLASAITISEAQAQSPKQGKAGAFIQPRKGAQAQPGKSGGRPEFGNRPDAGTQRGPSQQGDRGRVQTDRRPDQSPRSQPDRDFNRGPSSNGSRSRLGISIGPGGVQVYRGPSGFGPGFGSPYPNYFGGGSRGRYYGRGWPGYGYYGNGWGIVIQTQPQIQNRTQTVVVPQATEEPESMPVPTAAEAAAMAGVEVRGLLLFAVDRLKDELNGVSTGDGWRDYLQLDELRRIVPAPPTAPPAPGEEIPADPPITPPAYQELTGILRRFDQTAANAEYGQISGMWGFQTIQVTLRELLVPPVERLHKQLKLSAEFLESDLQQIETGASWIAHLKTADLKRLATVRPQDFSSTDRQQLEDVISTFDRVAGDPSYRMISDLPGFRMASHVMRAYLDQLTPRAARAGAPPAPENVPVPPGPGM